MVVTSVELDRLSTQPPGTVIFLAHSTGGLLAAPDPSNNPDQYPGAKSKHIGGGNGPGKEEHSDPTDDWEEYKKRLELHPASNSSLKVSPPQNIYTPIKSSSRGSFPNSISRLNLPSPLVDRALSYIAKHSDVPIVRWLRTHADDPLSASKRWAVEHFQFGISMFDHRVGDVGLMTSEGVIGDQESHQSSNPSIHSPSSQPAEAPISHMTPQNTAKKLQEKNKQEKTQVLKSGKHFIVLPNGLGLVLGGMDKWEQVLIGGVEDEVTAHTGLFIPDQNLDYEGLVERVKARVLVWCENLSRFEDDPIRGHSPIRYLRIYKAKKFYINVYMVLPSSGERLLPTCHGRDMLGRTILSTSHEVVTLPTPPNLDTDRMAVSFSTQNPEQN
ncbi:hypothetical protein BYT27DRAFT_7342162 [Phlegmacium glaucopus]|nr:hypothetical protein BYT27DRAFT_7342162 [Phlegmacium glaucopus]